VPADNIIARRSLRCQLSVRAAGRAAPGEHPTLAPTVVLWWPLAAYPLAMQRVVEPLLERTVRSAIPVREVLEV